MGEGVNKFTGKRVAIAAVMAIAAEKSDEAAVEKHLSVSLHASTKKICSQEIASVNSSFARSRAKSRRPASSAQLSFHPLSGS